MTLLQLTKRLFTSKKAKLLKDLQDWRLYGCVDDIFWREEYAQYVKEVKAQKPDATPFEIIALVEKELSK